MSNWDDEYAASIPYVPYVHWCPTCDPEGKDVEEGQVWVMTYCNTHAPGERGAEDNKTQYIEIPTHYLSEREAAREQRDWCNTIHRGEN